jgi:small-conductance mechanosensitive channel
MDIHTNKNIPETPNHHPDASGISPRRQAWQITSECSHTIFKFQGQLSDHTAAQGSLLHADTEQEKKERESMNVMRDKLHCQAGFLHTLELKEEKGLGRMYLQPQKMLVMRT